MRARGRPSAEESDQLAMMAQMAHGDPVVGTLGRSQTSYALEPKKFRWWWEAIIDWMICNPGLTMKDAAKEFNCTPQYLYMLTSSDVFNERYRERIDAKAKALNEQVVAKVSETALAAVGLIADRLELEKIKPVESRRIELEQLSTVSDRLLKSLGLGAKQLGTVINNTNQTVIESGASPAAVELARQTLQRVQKREVEEAVEEPPPVPPSPLSQPPLAAQDPSVDLLDELRAIEDEECVTLVAGGEE